MKCKLCSKTYQTEYLYIIHLRKHFIPSVVYGICPVCGGKYHSQRCVTLHFIKANNDVMLHRALAYLFTRRGGKSRKNYYYEFTEVFLNGTNIERLREMII